MTLSRLKISIEPLFLKSLSASNHYFAPKNYVFLSLIFSLSIFSLNSSWMFNRYGWLDHFAYLGAAFYFPETIKQFPTNTIIELLPTYLPSAVLYHLLPPQWANFTKDIIYLSLSLFMFLRISFFLTRDNFVSYLTTIIIGSYLYFLTSIGSDYTDSTIQILCIFHLFVITRLLDEKDSWFYSKKAFFVLGALSALMFSSGVLSIVYVVNFAFFIVISIYLNKNILPKNLKAFALFFASWFLGALSVIILISLYLYSIGYDFYMKQNLIKLFGYLGGVFQNPDLMSWLPYSGWLILPIAVFFGSFHFLLKYRDQILSVFLTDKNQQIPDREGIYQNASIKKSNTKNFIYSSLEDEQDLLIRKMSFMLLLITTSLSMIFIQFIVKQWSLQFMYFSQVNFLYFLALGILLAERARFISQKNKFIIFMITLITASYFLHLTTYRVINFETILETFTLEKGSIIPWLSITLLITLMLYLLAKNYISPVIVIFSVLTLNLVSYSQSFGGFCCLDAYPLKFFGSNKTTSLNVFNDTIQLSKFLNALDKKRSCDIWFDDKELLGQIYRQVFSMNYFNLTDNMINKLLPELGDYTGPRGSSGHAPSPDRNIILISENEEKLKVALINLTNLLNKKLNYEIYHIKIGEVDTYIWRTK